MRVAEVKGDFSLDSVVPFFQPIIDMSENVVWSYECLARLVTQSEQMFLPSDFLHLVEEQYRSTELTKRIFHYSAQYFRDSNLAWSINLCEQDILDPDTVRFFRDYLQYYPNPSRVSVELMAKTVRQHRVAFEAFLAMCDEFGVRVILDHLAELNEHDIGLLDLPIAAIKIDSRQLANSLAAPESNNVMRMFTEKADKNDILIIAECIENAAALKAASSFNIQYGQGFYFSHPMPAQ